MSNVRTYHNEAIRAAQLAMAALHQGNQSAHRRLIEDAMIAETHAADLVPEERRAEPTRSILYRSAASFAYQAGEYAEAERLIFKGLAGYPPAEIRQQLLEVQQLIWDAMGDATHGSHANGHTNRQIVTALYENGVLHPTTALALAEAQVVTIQIMAVPEGLAL